MAVEIVILSGARQGQKLSLGAAEFTAGARPDCAVCFDPQLDPAVAGRTIAFRLLDDGWSVQGAAAGVLVNQQAVASPMRIRSGDVVQMSDRGPAFSFSVAPRGAAAISTPVRSAITPVAPVTPAGPNKPASAVVEQVASARAAVTLAEQQNCAPAPAAGRRGTPSWLIFAGGGLAVCVLLLLLIRAVLPTPPTPPPVVNVTVVPPPGYGAGTAKDSASEKSKEDAKGKEEKEAPSPPTVEEQIGQELKGAVFLIEVEKAGASWPVATCCAVGADTLLTSAREASQLAAWRNDPQKSYKVWIANPALGLKKEVKDIRVYAEYPARCDTPAWIFYDVGLVTVEGKLPHTATLASADELAGLKDGQPVFCFGFPHAGEKVTEFDRLEAQVSRARIFGTPFHPDLPGHPRLLPLKGKIPQIACGSPVVDDQGRLVAVYGEAAEVPKDATKQDAELAKELHYAPGMSGELLESWLKSQDAKAWVSPPLESRGASQVKQTGNGGQ